MQNNAEFDVPRFQTAIDQGEVIEKKGWHKPNSRGLSRRAKGCGCSKTTSKGAYRDMIVEYKDMTIYYFHQSPVVVQNKSKDLRLSACGWHTRTTKERINRYLPKGYRLFQRDFEWYLKRPEEEYGDTENTEHFESGMVISAEERVIKSL